MIPIFKQSGLIWTLFDTSMLDTPMYYYTVLIPLNKLVWSDEKIDLIKLINYENILQSHALPTPIFNNFNFICFTIRQNSQYQRNNKVIKITIYP